MKRKIVVLILLFSMVVYAFPTFATGDLGLDFKRTAGKNRIDTALKIAMEYFPSPRGVVLVRADDFADALSAGLLAYSLNYPILLTYTNELPKEVKSYISDPLIMKVLVVGGEKAISKKVFNDVRDNISASSRAFRVSGKDRYDTSVQIAKRFLKDGTTKNDQLVRTVLIVTGEDFPDAVCAGALSAKNTQPILLTKTNSLPTGTKEFIDEFSLMTVIIGGTSAVSKEVEEELKGTVQARVAGKNRYDTAKNLAETFVENSGFCIASGEAFADALVIAPAAAKYNMPILLSRKNSLPEELRDYCEFKAWSFLRVIGGQSAVSNDVIDEVFKYLKY